MGRSTNVPRSDVLAVIFRTNSRSRCPSPSHAFTTHTHRQFRPRPPQSSRNDLRSIDVPSGWARHAAAAFVHVAPAAAAAVALIEHDRFIPTLSRRPRRLRQPVHFALGFDTFASHLQSRPEFGGPRQFRRHELSPSWTEQRPDAISEQPGGGKHGWSENGGRPD